MSNAVAESNRRRTLPPMQRFWRYVEKTDTCWLWTGGLKNNGYGNFFDGKRTVVAHRWLWSSINGEPKGEIDHLCRVRNCVNPAHLEDVTRQVNVLRGISFCARNAVKTHCPNGHPYDIKDNGRRCSVCRRVSLRLAGRKYDAKRVRRAA
jgi:hypothetical protein